MSQSVNGTLTTYVLDTATPLTMVLAETTAGETITYWHALDTLAQSDGTSVEYFAYDGLGSVRQLVDATGSVGLAQTFDPYGNGYAKSGSAQSALGYTGEQTDGNGFVFLRARYYQPGMGRFTQMDPSRQERNAYLYAASNPVMFVDPSGLICRSSYTAEDCARAIVESYRESSSDPSDLEALAQLFVHDELSPFRYPETGSTAQERLEFILRITRGGSQGIGKFQNFAILFGETGLRIELQDGWLYTQNCWVEDITPGAVVTNQIGHFLTAVNIAYNLVFMAESEMKRDIFGNNWSAVDNIGIAAVIGHEMIGDTDTNQPDQLLAGLAHPELAQTFIDAVADDINGLYYQRNLKLEKIFYTGGYYDDEGQFHHYTADDTKWEKGNSLNDLKLDVKGFSFAAWIRYGAANFSRVDAANWLRRELG